MIVQPTKNSWLFLLTTWRGSILVRIWPRLLVTVLFAASVTITHKLALGDPGWTLTPLPFSLVGVALSIFLGFRNNTSYDRFWEGRKLWGSLVNSSRSMARQCLTLIGPLDNDPDEVQAGAVRSLRRDMVYHVVAYVHSLRFHLRNEETWGELSEFLPADELERLPGESNPPIAILQSLAERLREAYDRGWIHAYHLPVLESSLTSFTNIQGGCERIKSTPIPFSYSALIHRIVATYCVALPFGIVAEVGWLTPAVVLFVSYAFYGLDAIGDEIEEPFGEEENDLPLATLSRMIEVNLRQKLGETDLPPLLKPDDAHRLS